MNEKDRDRKAAVRRVRELLMELIPLYHQKLGALFHGIADPRHRCTKNQNRAIMILAHHGGETPSRLGGFLDMKKGSLTSLVDSLETMGLVRREADPSDRRKTRLALTGEGKAYVERRTRGFEEALAGLLASLPEEEALRFGDCLENVVELMNKLRKDS